MGEILSMLNENWLRLDRIEFLLCWVFECGRRLCPCALEKVLDCFQLLFALTQLLNFFDLHFFIFFMLLLSAGDLMQAPFNTGGWNPTFLRIWPSNQMVDYCRKMAVW